MDITTALDKPDTLLETC